MSEIEARRYRIIGIIGRGGFGRVYRARLEGPEGFSKEVAVKLLTDNDIPESLLKRFRDEARILGLVRDRAIVSVDPPTRLGGRWAVVMELVDGASCAILLRKQPLPLTVALEIIAEVSRALDKVYRTGGPDGQPLHLLHRDLKPGNLQITPSGDVKILDFGIARATFANREAETIDNIAGTLGYIAPERLEGEESPAGDVYSLGVVLQVLVTGDKPVRMGKFKSRGNSVPDSQELRDVLDLAHRMRSLEPEHRPTAREVEDLCGALRARIDGPTLRQWSEAHVPASIQMSPDELVGQTLTETLATIPRIDRSASTSLHALETPAEHTFEDSTRSSPSGTSLSVIILGLVAVLIGIFLIALNQGPRIVQVPAPQPAPEALSAEPPPQVGGVADGTDEAPSTAAEPPPEPADAPNTVAVAPAPAAEPRAPSPRVETPALEAAPTPATEPAAPPQPDEPLYSVLFSSLPMGAEVFVDGERVGLTPIKWEGVAGSHRLRIVSDGEGTERDIVVGRRAPNRYILKIGEGEWEAFN